MAQGADFDAFYAGSVRRLVGQLYALTGDLGAAEDCVQEAYARAWQRWNQVHGYRDPVGWVRTVAFRLAISRWRRARTGRLARVRHGAPEPVAAPSPDHVVVVEALQQLPEPQRLAIVLFHIADLSVAQVAAQTGRPEGTIKAQLSRGRARLAELLTEQSPLATHEVRDD